MNLNAKMFRDDAAREEELDREIERLKTDLRDKRDRAIAYLGEKWILHPAHTRSKLDLAPNTLGKMS